MEENHIRKKRGRFIKKDDPIQFSMAISEFNLIDICEFDVTYADNVEANIIHSRLHLDDDIKAGVKPPDVMETEFDPAEYRPVIKPLDFTQEWKRQRAQYSGRASHLDDEDLDMDEFHGDSSNFEKNMEQKERAIEIGEVKRIGDELKFEHSIDKTGNLPNEHTEDEMDDSNGSAISGVNEESIDDYESKANEDTQIELPKEDLSHIASAINQASPILQTENEMQDKGLSSISMPNAADQDAFVPLAPQENKLPPISDKERSKAFEEAKSKGYEDGYKDGEDKATTVVQGKINEVLMEFNKIIHEFEGMKSNILTSAQDNFRVVCESMIESLLQKEFSINPSSFESIVERAIAEAVPDDEFKILVSQETYENIKDELGDQLKDKLKVDQNIEDHNFKIESKLSVVDGNISQIISDLLSQADINLFKKNENEDVG